MGRGRVRSARAADVAVPVNSMGGVRLELSADRARLRVRLPVGTSAVVVDLSRVAAIDLAELVAARVPEMAEPEVVVPEPVVVPMQTPRVVRRSPW
ncbi:hypothetical protein [Kutzneria albida]|uniref:Uncharacterized protein n=1 Tax=Kutzneria albida DSM 43870 TaxID=1449976 RepID=W5W9L0_9PSEU|nr:hypothetical protein [Kutzneria albida]AHH94889.1 hypothetical protein KALB_1516 [Kutzneria albida DSM 43870]